MTDDEKDIMTEEIAEDEAKDDSQAEEEATGDEITTNEDDEQTAEDGTQTDYTEQIAELDARLGAFRAQKVDALKRQHMEKAGYTGEQIERYILHITGENTDEIQRSLSDFRSEIPAGKKYADPSLGNSGGYSTATMKVDGKTFGRKLYENIVGKKKGR